MKISGNKPSCCHSKALDTVRKRLASADESGKRPLSGELEKRIEHAWCERGPLVIDLAMPVEVRVVDREQYYRVIRPEVSRRYSAEDALVLSIRNGHHGPWDESEQLKK